MIPLPPAEFTQLTPEEFIALEKELRTEDRSRMGVIPWVFAAWFIMAVGFGLAVA